MEDLTINLGEWRLNCRVAAIIIHDNKVLVHHNTNETYLALVGGRIKIGESSEDAVKREFKEETGKDIKVTGYISTIENFFELHNKKYHEFTFVHKAEFVDEQDKKITSTIKNIEANKKDELRYEWIDISTIDKAPLRPAAIKSILKEGVFPKHTINNDIKAHKYFEYIFQDKEIREIYSKIGKKEDDDTWAHHDWSHIMNVMNTVEKILKDFDYDIDMIESAKIAALLHDTGVIDGKKNHAYRSYEFAKKYFEKNNMEFNKKEMVLEAIKNHSDGFDTDNIIQLALILADKIDIKYTRVTTKGLEIEGMRQMQYINDIILNIDKENFKVKFITDKKINKKELEEYYFLKKVGNAIKAFSDKFNLKYEVYFNEEIWNEIL